MAPGVDNEHNGGRGGGVMGIATDSFQLPPSYHTLSFSPILSGGELIVRFLLVHCLVGVGKSFFLCMHEYFWQGLSTSGNFFA